MGAAEEVGEGEDFWGDEGKLIGGIEGVGLRVGEVVDGVEAEEDVA